MTTHAAGRARPRPAGGAWVRSWRLRTYFAVLVALFLAAAGAAALYVHAQTGRDGRRAAESDARFAAQAAAQQLSTSLGLVQASVAQLAANPQITQVFDAAQACSLTFGGIGGGERSHLDILRPDATVGCSSSPAIAAKRVRHSGSWLRRARAGPVLVAPVTDPATDAPTAIAAAPIAGGQGVVAAFVELAPLGPHLASLYGSGAPTEFLVTSAGGREVLGRSIHPERWIGTSLVGTAFTSETVGAARDDLDGRPRLYASAPVTGVGWTVYAGIDEAAALAAGERLERRQLAIITVGLLAVLLAAWLVHRNLVMPIGRLSGMLRSVSEDPGAARVVQTSGPLELRGLGDDVSQLVGAVQAELASRERAEAQARAVLDAALDGVVTIDHHGRIVEFNPAAEEMFGRSRDDVLGESLAELIPPSYRPGYKKGFERYLSTGESNVIGERLEISALRADGSEFPVELTVSRVPLDGPPVFTGFVRDISDRKRAEAELRVYARRLETLAEIQHAILAAHSLEDIAYAAISRLRPLVGVPRTSVTLFDQETGDLFIVASDTEDGTAAPLGLKVPAAVIRDLEALRRGEPLFTDLQEFPDAPPVLRDLVERGLPFFVSFPLLVDGRLVGTLNLAQRTPFSTAPSETFEIAKEVANELALALSQASLREQLASHAEELERRVAERTAELEAANKELEAFSYSVSHDLRAPLRAIDGFSRIVLEDHAKDLSEDGRRYLRLVSESALDMGRLIDGLLDFSRLGRRAMSVDPVELDAVIREVLADCALDVDGREVDVEVGELPVVRADRLLVKQVLANLVSNAFKFTRTRDDARVEIGSFAENGDRVVFVRDNGVGFDMRHADKLFGVFQRLHRADEFEGTGVGLALVGRIVARHGGRAWADGRPGEGATFYFTLPTEEPT